MQKLLPNAIAFAAAFAMLGGQQAQAAGNVDVKLTLSATGKIGPVTNTNLGTGFDFLDAYLTAIFKTEQAYTQAGFVDTGNSYQAIKDLNFGTYRFPMGTSAEHYYWNAPCRSYQTIGLPVDQILRPEDVFEKVIKRVATANNTAYREALGSQVLWQVNTYSSVDGEHASDCSWNPNNGGVYYRTATKVVDGVTQLDNVNPVTGTFAGSGLDYVAQSAGALVGANRGMNAAHQITYWEIGNEDWSRLTAIQYAQIFVKVGLQMKAAHLSNPGAGLPLRLLAQTTDDGSWAAKFAAEVKRYGALAENRTLKVGNTTVTIGLSDVYGLSLHSYANGDQNTDINVRTKLMYSRNDMATDITHTQAAINKIQSDYWLANKWKLWVTEYSACEVCGGDDLGGAPVQTLNQGLVIADKAAHMMTMGVERIIVHSLDQHPKFALVSWDINNNGGTFNNPRKMASGLALQKLNAIFSGNMYTVTLGTGTNGFQAKYTDFPGGSSSNFYLGLTAYAVVDATNTKLNVMLVNRDLVSATTANLVPSGRTFKTGVKTTTSTELSGPMVSTNSSPGNNTAPLQVMLVDKAAQDTGSTVQVSVPAGGMKFVTIPLN